MQIPPDISCLIDRGALIAINHSGGKDSQAMTITLLEAGIPRDQLLIVHAALGDVEWPGTIRHIRNTTFGLPLVIARPRRSFFEMVRARGMFPSPRYRQCTSDQKRGPIERELRRYLAANPRFARRIVSAMGMRAEESAARRRRPVVRMNTRNNVAGRTWVDWLPIHHFTRQEVFDTISNAGQEPHWAYGQGMSRHSEAEITEFARRTLDALDTLLGDKPYLFGDRPTAVDATLAADRSADYARAMNLSLAVATAKCAVVLDVPRKYGFTFTDDRCGQEAGDPVVGWPNIGPRGNHIEVFA